MAKAGSSPQGLDHEFNNGLIVNHLLKAPQDFANTLQSTLLINLHLYHERISSAVSVFSRAGVLWFSQNPLQSTPFTNQHQQAINQERFQIFLSNGVIIRSLLRKVTFKVVNSPVTIDR